MKYEKAKRKRIKKIEPNSFRQSFIIWGKHSIEAAILNNNRIIKTIYSIKQNIVWLNEKFDSINRKKSEIKTVDKILLSKFSGDAPHQGLVAEVNALEWPSLDTFLNTIDKSNSRIVVLDQVTDPQNIGSIIRISQAFNANAIITTKNHFPNENGLMVKASAGAIETMPMIRVTNLSRALEIINKADFELIGLENSGSYKLEDIAGFRRIALVLGSEGRGLRRLTKEKLSYLVKIPIAEKTESLNVSTAAAIALYVIRN